MALNREKFKALVQYVCATSEPTKLGATKLNKALWRADFRAYYELGASITGARYTRQPFGPVPDWVTSVLRELQHEGTLSVADVKFFGQPKKEYRSLTAPRTDLFSEAELRIADEAIRFVTEEHTARSISEFSHDRIWQSANDGEEIPYHTIFAVPGEIGDDERDWAHAVLSGEMPG